MEPFDIDEYRDEDDDDNNTNETRPLGVEPKRNPLTVRVFGLPLRKAAAVVIVVLLVMAVVLSLTSSSHDKASSDTSVAASTTPGPVRLFGTSYHVASTTDVYRHGHRLKGPFPSEIGTLTALTVLELYHGALSGNIPSEIGLLSSTLNVLVLKDCGSLNGTVPSEIGLLTALKVLRLEDDKLSGSVPTEMGLLTALEELLLPNNQLVGSVPGDLCANPQLKEIRVDCPPDPSPVACACDNVCQCTSHETHEEEEGQT
ncbi:STYKc [Seminavis robusta]|uniref:STYKc n=1 Tax=Seminavis robusta TaxID=568900 RepID=A0A9N8DWR4_9STRA|nr:STYKc [Seminavis robusta]|eukprot:Sro410_g137320.1 STYKc (258) ;mRNA; f:8272-9045